jgi:hypothetical protein
MQKACYIEFDSSKNALSDAEQACLRLRTFTDISKPIIADKPATCQVSVPVDIVIQVAIYGSVS